MSSRRAATVGLLDSFQLASLLTAVASALCMRPTGPPAAVLEAVGLAAARFGAAACGLAGATAAFDDAAEMAALSMRKLDTRSFMVFAWCSSVLAVAAFSSTSAEFCWVTSSICDSALLTCSRPVACSALARRCRRRSRPRCLMESTIRERRAGAVDQIDAVLDLIVRVGDQVLDVLGGLRRALRQAANFRRHHREAAAGFAGARRFDRGVERQQIGLPRDLVDHADDVGDLA